MYFKDRSKVIEGNLSNGCFQDSDFHPDIHVFRSLLVTSKARLASLVGLTIPRSKLSSLQSLTRLLAKTIKALTEPPSNVYILGDSTCVISAMDTHLCTLDYQIFIIP